MLKRSYAQLHHASSSSSPCSAQFDTQLLAYTTTTGACNYYFAADNGKMKTLQISNANVNTLSRSSSTSSLRRSSSGVETLKKLKKYDSAGEAIPASAVDEEERSSAAVSEISSLAEPQLEVLSAAEDSKEASVSKKELLLADEEECAPGATKSNDSTPTVEVKAEIVVVAPAAAVAKVVEVPKELAKESEDERECYRHAIVDVPALVELLTLIGRCPVCKSPLRTDKIATDEQTAVVNVSLRCARPRCQFTKHWCSSPTAGITDPATK